MLIFLVAAVGLVKLASRFPEQTVIEYNRTLLGNFLGTIVGLSFVVAFGFLTSMLMREYADVFTIAIDPNTPLSVYILLISGLLVYAVRGGLPTIARLAQLWFPIVFISHLVLVVLGIGEFQMGHLRPLLGPGPGRILSAGWYTAAVFAEGVIFLWLYPFLRRKEKALKALWSGTAVAGMLLISVTIETVAIMGAAATAEETFPLLTVVRLITLGSFVERLESVFMIFWLVSAFVKLAVTFWASAFSLAQVLRIPSYKPLLLPLIAVYYTAAFIPDHILQVFYATSELVSRYWPIVGYAIPLILLVVLMTRRGEPPRART